jgi:UDP-N-acetylmuramate--alanine ligase
MEEGGGRPGVVFIDDYAHHPEELRALITGAKGLFGNMQCTVLFQPHLFTRTRDLAAEFAEVLDMADEVVLLPIYPARELPIAGVTSNMILDKMKNEHKQVMGKEQLLQWIKDKANSTSIKSENGWLLITAGAGDIDALVQPIKQIIETK